MGTNCSNHQEQVNRVNEQGPVVLANDKAPRWNHLPGSAADAVTSRVPIKLAAYLSALCCMALPSSSGAVLFVENAPGISVIPANEVIADYTHPSLDGELLFEDPSGSLVRLITSTDDPEIANPGDGSFHAADAAAVVAALQNLPVSFIAPLFVQVFVLPYPRSGMVSSSATAHAIYISPGVHPLEDGETLRALVVHELGHVIHQHFLSSDPSTWNTYIAIRELGDDNIFHPNASHSFRPVEIFAEDFRSLFGDELASSTTIENPTLDAPDQVPGLDVWFTNLAASYTFLSSVDDAGNAEAMRVYPNPVRGGSELTVQWSHDATMPGAATSNEMSARLYDVSGRIVEQFDFQAHGDATWTATIPPLAAGTYWLRPVDVSGNAVPIRVTR